MLNQITVFTLAVGIVNPVLNRVELTSGGELVNPAYDPD